MSQARLNHLMNIHKEETDQMSLAEVAKLPQRREDFGINKFMWYISNSIFPEQ